MSGSSSLKHMTKAVTRVLKTEKGKKNVDESQIFAFRTKQCEIVESATTATKAMRRKGESQRRPLSVKPVVSAIDYEQKAIPSPGEIWIDRS